MPRKPVDNLTNVKTQLSQVPISNDRLVRELAREHDVPILLVRESTIFVGEFISQVMSEGNMNEVRLPAFGAFKPRKNRLNYDNRRIRERENGFSIIRRAIRGELPAVYLQDQTEIDETIRDRPEHTTGTAEQGMDSTDS